MYQCTAPLFAGKLESLPETILAEIRPLGTVLTLAAMIL